MGIKSKAKRLGLLAILLPLIAIIGLVLVEAFLSIQSYRHWKNWDRDVHIIEREELQKTLGTKFLVGRDSKSWESRLKLHHYFGYVFDQSEEREINRFGFQTRYDFRRCDTGLCVGGADGDQGKPFVVGIFGGSLAHMVGEQADRLEKILSQWLKKRTVRVVNLAIGGHASPTSLFVFSYFREALDAAIFLDGVHEIWSGDENNKQGWPPDGVRLNHYGYLIGTSEWDEKSVVLANRVIEKREALISLTKLSLAGWWRQSLIVHQAWGFFGSPLMKDLVQAKGELLGSKRQEAFLDGSPKEMFRWLAQRWARFHGDASVVAKESGVVDLHLLQPNPHVPNAKAITSREEHILKYSFPIRELIIQAYPEFQKAAKEAKSRVQIDDLSRLYHGEGQEIWRDGIHPNEKGFELLLNDISRRLQERMATREKKKSHWR